MRLGFYGVVGMALLMWPGAVSGQLAFETMLLEAKVDPSEDTLEVRFPFGNGSGDVVSIVKIDTSCGCLKASADLTEVGPGEKGVVTGVFSVGTRTGTFEKGLTVRTVSGGREVSQELRVRVEVPAVVSLTPTLVSWNVGEALTPKVILLKVLRDEPIRVTEANSSREGFQCEVKEVVEGKEYRLVITPGSTAEPLMGIVRIETDCEIEKHRRNLVFFSVKHAPES